VDGEQVHKVNVARIGARLVRGAVGDRHIPDLAQANDQVGGLFIFVGVDQLVGTVIVRRRYDAGGFAVLGYPASEQAIVGGDLFIL
jgi:hypothetical protein